jgi:hypothetical protein
MNIERKSKDGKTTLVATKHFVVYEQVTLVKGSDALGLQKVEFNSPIFYNEFDSVEAAMDALVEAELTYIHCVILEEVSVRPIFE